MAYYDDAKRTIDRFGERDSGVRFANDSVESQRKRISNNLSAYLHPQEAQTLASWWDGKDVSRYIQLIGKSLKFDRTEKEVNNYVSDCIQAATKGPSHLFANASNQFLNEVESIVERHLNDLKKELQRMNDGWQSGIENAIDKAVR